MTAPVRFPRFFVTSPAPCPYLPGKSERKVFTELKGPHADELNDALGRIGFRRSQTVAYRPSCIDCQACVSVRVVAGEFRPSTSQKRNLKRNGDLVSTVCRPWSTVEQFELRAARVADELADAEIAKLRDKYETKIETARRQIAEASDRIDVLEEEAHGKRNSELLSTAGSILGGLLGGRSRRGLLGKLGGAASRRGRTAASKERVDAAENKVSRLEASLAELETELEAEVTEIDTRWMADAKNTETLPVGLERADVTVTQLALAWMPAS